MQTGVVYALGVLWFVHASRVSGEARRPFGEFDLDHYRQALVERDMILTWVSIGVIIAAAQMVLLWPVRRPTFRLKRGWSVKTSLALAGLAFALLVLGIVNMAIGLLQLIEFEPMIDDPGVTMLVIVAMGYALLVWLPATLLLLRFTRRRTPEQAIGDASAWVLRGTVIEVLAAIPLDVMLRRKTDCYCFAGTFWTLTICGVVGVFVAGPAILLPLLARRRREWYSGRCDVCGYDMRTLAGAERCPECGAGWADGSPPPPARA